ncbi:DNA repair protein RadA [Candidatus Gracilibacteria bacterium]|nr:DNA repair protein RadA [Candidatus Gracilibacteria bacterium]MCF7819156.1 DNA repair protein RadA [Candidatus Gracilibacteria bacterium]
MPKTIPQFLCTECGETLPKWMGKCPSCGEWNTIKEFRESKTKSFSTRSNAVTGSDLTIRDKKKESILHSNERIPSGIEEVDRVIGSGFFPGSLVLFGGSPGVGKSTLALQIFLKLKKAFYFSGEESSEQVFQRAERIQKQPIELAEKKIFSTNSLEDIIQTIESQKPDVAVIDSIQMVGLEGSQLGQISQLRENAEVLLRLAKSTGTAILLIGHVTKSEELAGPKILEHIVDTVLYLEGERNSELRILRTSKNRFGSTFEVGVFEMTSKGLKELQNPSEFFLSERADKATGSAITVVREGARNFLLEIQTLTVKTNFGQPRRTSHGIDLSKMHLLLAVISKFTPFKSEMFDAYINVVNGFRIRETSADLAVVAAFLSSLTDTEIPADTIILGEVGLSGEIRSVPHLESRLSEAEKLGFKRAIVPRIKTEKFQSKTLQIQSVKSIQELMKELFGKKN